MHLRHAIVLTVALCGAAASAEARGPAEDAFIAQFARTPGVKRAPAMHYLVKASGPADGRHPTRNSAVKVRYEGREIDGKVFDNGGGAPMIYPVRALAPGFQQALLMMRPGDRWEVVIPPELAYGSAGSRLSNRVLIFDIEVLEIGELPPPAPPMLAEMPK